MVVGSGTKTGSDVPVTVKKLVWVFVGNGLGVFASG